MSIARSAFCLLITMILLASTAKGQAARSPFSSYGLGEQYGTALAPAQGMGGVGISNPQFFYINNQNPALLVYNRLTTFQAGIIGESRSQESDSVSEKSGNGNLNYLVMAVPVISGWWTTSFGLMPYTRLNYLLNYSEPIPGTGEYVDIVEQGTGGINQFYWSNGVSLNPYISIGIKAAYVFSSTESTYGNLLLDSQVPLSARVYDRTNISDFIFTPGLSIHLDSLGSKNHRLNFGLVYDIKTDLNALFHRRIERWNLGGQISSDTVILEQPGKITMPGNLMFGMSFSPYPFRWTVALDGAYADYSTYRDLEGKNRYESNAWRIAGGFEITPDRNSLSNYLKRMTFRTGVSVENAPFLANGNTVRDFGITFGVSLPVNRISSLDLAMKWGRKGDKAVNAIEESYFKIYFGITFNDQWFIKRRFD